MGAAASLLWSAVFPCLRWIFTHHEADAVTIACMRYVIAGAALLAFLAMQGRVGELAVGWRHPGRFAFLGATGIAGMGAMVAWANDLTESINVAVLMNANPILIVLLGASIGERLTGARMGGIVLGLAGCILVVQGNAPGLKLSGTTDLLGCGVAMIGALCWAVYTLASKRTTRQHGGVVTTTLAILMGGLMLAAVVLVADRPVNLHPHILLVMAFVGLLPTAVAFTLWNAALNHIEAGAAGPLQYLSPVGAMLLAWPLLGERPTWSLLGGLALIVSGVTICTRDELRRGDAPTDPPPDQKEEVT